MKCSLLTLSTYIDEELSADRRAEVDAHLVGCTVCSTGATTLRQERSRIGQLARVRVAPASTRLMLEQLGISGADDVAATPRAVPQATTTPTDEAPWHSAQSSKALPWTPRRPGPVGAAAAPPPLPVPMPAPPVSAAIEPLIEEIPVLSADDDVQPDLPFDSSPVMAYRETGHGPVIERSGSAEAEPVLSRPSPSPPQLAPDPVSTDPAKTEASISVEAETSVSAMPDPGQPVDEGSIPSDGWEVELPPAAVSPAPDRWSAPIPAQPPDDVPVGPGSFGGPPLATGPPTRVSSTGPVMMWSRLRDAVAVRMALSRNGEAIEDSIDIVNGAAPRRGAPRPPSPPATPQRPLDPPAIPASAETMQLTGVSGAGRQASLHQADDHLGRIPSAEELDAPLWTAADETPIHSAWTPAGRSDVEPAAAAPEWNAFAASSYMHGADEPAPLAAPAPERARPLGRHSRAVARDGNEPAQRLRAAVAALAAIPSRLRAGNTGASKGAHAASAAGESSHRDRRIIAAIAAVAVIFLTALVIGHGSSAPSPAGTASRVSPAHSSAPAASAPTVAPPAVVAPAPSAKPPATATPTVQTIGAGATGFQVLDLRYGQQPGYMRIVFDMGPVSGNNGASPTATVASSGPTTLLVSFAGTLPAGSAGSPPPGTVVSSVSLASASGGKVVYKITLTHAVTPSELYLAGTSPPLRFVLDLH